MPQAPDVPEPMTDIDEPMNRPPSDDDPDEPSNRPDNDMDDYMRPPDPPGPPITVEYFIWPCVIIRP